MVELVERLRLLEQDHEPDGWPAVRMRDITALLDELEAAQEDVERLYRMLRLIESAKDRGFGIDYARGVAQSALREYYKESDNV